MHRPDQRPATGYQAQFTASSPATPFSAGSLRLWSAARHVTDGPSLFAGADIAGIDPFMLHRQITRGHDRGRLRSR